MLKEILSAYRNKVGRSNIDPSQYQNVASDIAITNWKRLRIFMALTLLFEILLIFFIDIPGIDSSVPEELWLARSYLILHLIIGLTAFTAIILTSVLLRNAQNQKNNNLYVIPVLLVIILTCLSIITGLDQIKTGEISAFVINLLVCSVVMLFPFRISFFIYTIPFGVFIAAMFVFEPDVAVRNSHFINGGIFWAAVLVISEFMYDNRISHLIKNIKLEEANRKLEAANQQLSILSSYDPLTNLSNRRNFEFRIKQELALVKRFNQNSWLILIDIDHFKNINDGYGHACGDQVLQGIAAFLQRNIRDVDLACRWGGEEFLLLIIRTELEGIKLLANRLCKMLAEMPLDIGGEKIPITASFGVAMLTTQESEEDDFQSCYRLADQALYCAKQNGRNQVVILES